VSGTAAGSLVGRENVYVCTRCHGLTVTIDVDAGTTPFAIDCRASGRRGDCRALAHSSFYPEGPRPTHIPPPAWEWYKPSDVEARRADKKAPGMLDHARRGGLFLRPRAVAQADGVST